MWTAIGYKCPICQYEVQSTEDLTANGEWGSHLIKNHPEKIDLDPFKARMEEREFWVNQINLLENFQDTEEIFRRQQEFYFLSGLDKRGNKKG